jgi:hypothetical protein
MAPARIQHRPAQRGNGRRRGGQRIVNYPAQQLSNGRGKNFATFGQYKKLVRILKRIEK